MTKEEILAAAGYPNTPDGIAAFYNEYDTPEKFFAKHGGIPKAQTGKSKAPSEKSWGEMTPKERAAYLDKKEALQKQNKKADAWAKKAEAKSREQAKKEYYKDWVAENYDKGAMNPMFQTVAGFTPMGAIPFAMQSGVSALNNLGQGNYLEAGIDAAFATPLLRGLKGTKKVVPKVKHKVGQMEGLASKKDIGEKYLVEGPGDTPYHYVPSTKTWTPMFGYKDWMHGTTDVPSFNRQLNQMMTTAQFGKRPLETKIGPTNVQKALIRPEDLEYIGNDIPLIQYGQYMDTDLMPGKVKPYTGYHALQTLQPNKYGGLSGASHNGQPTADQFFDYGSHANDKLNIPMSNPFYLEEGGAYYGGPTRPFAYGGDITEYCWGGGLPGGPNEIPEMLHGGYHSPMNYGSFPATEWGGALDASNQDAFPMMEEGGLKQFLKSVSKAKKKAYKEGGKTTIQGGNQNFLQNRRAAFDDALKNNVQNAFIQEEEKAAMQAMNPYAAQDMQEEDQEYTEAKYGLSTYRKRGEKKPQDDDRLIDYRKAYPDLFPVGRDYSRYLPANIQSQYMMSNADYAKMADLNKRVQSGTFKLNENGFEGTPEWGPMARLLGKTGRKWFGPKSVTYKFTGRGVKQVPVQDAKPNSPSQLMNDYYNQGSTEFEDTAGISTNKLPEEKIPQYKYRNLNLPPVYNEDNYGTEYEDRANYSDQYIQKQAALPIDDGSLMQKAKGYYSPFAQFFTPSTYGPGYSSENFEVDPSKLRTTPDAATARKMQEFIKNNKKYGGGLNKYQGGGLTPEQYDELIRLYNAAEQASKTSKKNQATLDFQKKFHEYEPTKQIAQGLLKERQAANNPTAYGRTLGADQMYSTLSNEDMYFGDTTKRYRAGLENLKPQSQPTATPAPVTGTYPKLEDMIVPQDTQIKDLNLNFKSSTPVPAMTPNNVSLTSSNTGNLTQPAGNLTSSNVTQGNTPAVTDDKTKQESKNLTQEELGPEEIIESKIKRKTKGIGKAVAQYAPGIANRWASILEQQDPTDPMQNHPVSFGNRGGHDINSGEFRPHLKVPVQFPGGYGAYRMEYGGIPKALSGLEVKMQPGLYGTNGNRQFSLPTQVDSQKFSQQPVSVRDSLTAVPRDQANLEAEGGETALVNIDGFPAHFKISGKRHSQGGVPLDLPDNSFIYSDTASMKIKDPNILAQFGMAPKKGGYTPAEIAKKYDINKYRKILSDPNSEALERKTAEAMIANNNMKLAKLAMAQESIKGFPQGIPVVAMPYMMANDIDPSMYIPTQGQEEQPDEDMGVQRYGGNIVAQYPTMRYGGLPKAQKGLDAQEAKLVQEYKKAKKEGNDSLAKQIDKQLNDIYIKKTMPQVQAKVSNENVETEDDYKRKQIEAYNYLNTKPETSFWDFVGGFKDLGKAIAAYSQIAMPGYDPLMSHQMKALDKLSPEYLKEHPAGYLGNLLTTLESGTNYALTGRYQPTGNLWTGLALDPTSGAAIKEIAAAPKVIYQASKELSDDALKYAYEYGPKVYNAAKELAKKGYTLSKEAVEWVAKNATKGAEWLGKNFAKFLNTRAANVTSSAITRSIAGYEQDQEKTEKYKKLELQNQLLKEQLEKSKQSPDALVVRPSKPKETSKINVNAELAKKLTIAQAKKAEAEYAQAMQNMNRFTGYTNIPQEERLASLRTLGQQMIPAATPMVAPSAPVVAPAAPVKNVEVKKKPAAKTSNIDWENVDWSKYEVKKSKK